MNQDNNNGSNNLAVSEAQTFDLSPTSSSSASTLMDEDQLDITPTSNPHAISYGSNTTTTSNVTQEFKLHEYFPQGILPDQSSLVYLTKLKSVWDSYGIKLSPQDIRGIQSHCVATIKEPEIPFGPSPYPSAELGFGVQHGKIGGNKVGQPDGNEFIGPGVNSVYVIPFNS